MKIESRMVSITELFDAEERAAVQQLTYEALNALVQLCGTGSLGFTRANAILTVWVCQLVNTSVPEGHQDAAIKQMADNLLVTWAARVEGDGAVH